MKALTVSELNSKLIELGFSATLRNDIPENKWGADGLIIFEYKGISYLELIKRTSQFSSIRVLSYSKLKAQEKHELANFLLSIKN